MLLSLVALAPLLQPAPGAPSPRLTLEMARQIVHEEGARRAAASGLDPYWGQLLDSIASGASGWLDLAGELRAQADAEAAKTLDAAMGEALRQAPERVLRRLEGHPFSVPNVCGNTFASSGIRGTKDEGAAVTAQQAAVAQVRDSKVKSRRDACLQQIREHLARIQGQAERDNAGRGDVSQ